MIENTKVEVTMSEQEKAWVSGGVKAPEPKAVEVPAKEDTLPPMEKIEEGTEPVEETPETITQPKDTPEDEAVETRTIDIEAQVKPLKDDMERLEKHASRLTKLAENYKKQADAGDPSARQAYNEIVSEYNDIAKEYGEREKLAVGIQEKGQAVNMLTGILNNTPKEIRGVYKPALTQAIKMTVFTGNANNFVDNVLRLANNLMAQQGQKPVIPASVETTPPAPTIPDDIKAKTIIKKVGTASGKTTNVPETTDIKSLKERAANGDKEAQRKLFSRNDPFYKELQSKHR